MAYLLQESRGKLLEQLICLIRVKAKWCMQMLVKGIEAWSEITNRWIHPCMHIHCMLGEMGLPACGGDLEPDNNPLNLTFNLGIHAVLQEHTRLAELAMDGAFYLMEEGREKGGTKELQEIGARAGVLEGKKHAGSYPDTAFKKPRCPGLDGH
jgi:hypothetical protein